MTNAETEATRPKFRMDLRSVFVWTLYFAIGLAIGSSPGEDVDSSLALLGFGQPQLHWFYALLGAASAAIAAGLVQQAFVIRNQLREGPLESPPLRSAAKWEAGLRFALAGVILTCLIARMLVARKFVELPEDEMFYYHDVLTGHVWWLAILIALSDALVRADSKTIPRRRWFVVDVSMWIAAGSIVLYLGIDLSFVTYLVHLACRGVDVSLHNHQDRYPNVSAGDEILLLATAAAAMAAVMAATVLAAAMLSKLRRSEPVRHGSVLLNLLFLIGAGSYCVWFRSVAFHHFSPDLADAGLCSRLCPKTGL